MSAAPVAAANTIARAWRMAAAVVVLAGLVLITARLGPVYVANWRFQRFLDDFVTTPQNQTSPDDLVRATIANQASRLRLPVRAGQIRLNRAPRLGIEVRYVVPVDFALYTVDLHFRPRAGQR